jgi:hypothetical protein
MLSVTAVAQHRCAECCNSGFCFGVVMLIVIILSIDITSEIMLCIVVLNVIMLSVIMLSVDRINVAAHFKDINIFKVIIQTFPMLESVFVTSILV